MNIDSVVRPILIKEVQKVRHIQINGILYSFSFTFI